MGVGKYFPPLSEGNRLPIRAQCRLRFKEYRIYNAAGNFTKGVAVEEEEGGGPVTPEQELQRFPKSQGLDSGARKPDSSNLRCVGGV